MHHQLQIHSYSLLCCWVIALHIRNLKTRVVFYSRCYNTAYRTFFLFYRNTAYCKLLPPFPPHTVPYFWYRAHLWIIIIDVSRYLECNPLGYGGISLCPDGLVLSLEKVRLYINCKIEFII